MEVGKGETMAVDAEIEVVEGEVVVREAGEEEGDKPPRAAEYDDQR